MKILVPLVITALASVSLAQTPPIQPQTPSIKVPPRVTLPSETVEAGKKPLSVEEAVAIALKNQPTIGIARGNLTSAQGRTQQARSDLLPQFSLSGGFSRSSRVFGNAGSNGNGSNQFTSSVDVDQLLFDFGRARDTVRQQSALERAQQLDLLGTQQNVVFLVKQAFYDFEQNHEFTAIADANVTTRQHQLDVAQGRLDTGLGAPADAVQAKTNLADAVISLESARQTESASKVFLAQQMGINPLTPLEPTLGNAESPLDNEDDLQKLVEYALANRPDVKSDAERVNAAKFAVSAASKGDLPRVSANAGVGSRGANNPLDSGTGTFGLVVTWNFADGGFTAGAVKTARGAEEVARNQLIATSQAAVTEVSQTWLALKTAQQQIDTASDQVANATEFVRIAEGRYAGGLGDFLDVVSAQSSLVAAQRNLTAARLDVQRARAQLRVAIGLS